ncbi:hypothetical protein GCM10027579_25940 [Calidifontibacter terrae]
MLASAAIGLAGDRGDRAVLVDRCSWSAGADVVLGIDHLPGVRWADLAGADGRLDPEGLSRRLPIGDDGRCALAFGRDPADPVADTVLAAGLTAVQDGFDLVVTLGVAPSALVCRPGDLVCVVADSDVLSLATAVGVAGWLRERLIAHSTVVVGGRPDRGLLENLPDPLHRLQIRRADLRDLGRGRLCRGRSVRALAETLLDDLAATALRGAA